jgi:hypothetical protein
MQQGDPEEESDRICSLQEVAQSFIAQSVGTHRLGQCTRQSSFSLRPWCMQRRSHPSACISKRRTTSAGCGIHNRRDHHHHHHIHHYHLLTPPNSLALVDAQRAERNAIEKSQEAAAAARLASKELYDLRAKTLKLQQLDGNARKGTTRADAAGAPQEHSQRAHSNCVTLKALCLQRGICDNSSS